MPKIRGVKPDYWTDEDIVDLSIPARLLFIGLWTYACDNGHLQDKSKQIKMRVLPGDDVNVAELLRELEAKELITRADGWITIPNLTRHQKPDRRYFTTCQRDDCDPPPETVSQREARRVHGVQTPGTPSAHGGRTAGAHVDGDGDGEVMVKGSDGEAAPTEPAKASAKKKPAKHLPGDWAPTETHAAYCAEHGIDMTNQADRFRSHAEANDRRQVSWNAAFTQWLLGVPAWARGNVRQLRPDDDGRILLPPLPPSSPWGSS